MFAGLKIRAWLHSAPRQIPEPDAPSVTDPIADPVRRTFVRGLALGGTALAVGAWTSAGPGRRLDLEAFREGNRDRGPAADRFFGGVTELGSIWASVGAAAVVAATGHRRAAARGLAAASLTWIAGQALKRVFGRPRPYDANLDGMTLRIERPNGTRPGAS